MSETCYRKMIINERIVVFVQIRLLMIAYRSLASISTYEIFSSSLRHMLQFEQPGSLGHFISPSPLLTCLVFLIQCLLSFWCFHIIYKFLDVPMSHSCIAYLYNTSRQSHFLLLLLHCLKQLNFDAFCISCCGLVF